jgi:hypothetical protein
MSAPAASAADPLPRRSALPRRPGPVRPAGPGPSPRGELTAALGVAALVAHLIFAQLTLLLLGFGLVTGRVSRWRPLWLAAPAAAGTLWVAAIGLSRAVAGFVAGPRQVTAYLAGAPGHPGRLLHVSTAFAGAGHWLPRQLPLALVAAAAEAAIVARLGWPAGRRPDGDSGDSGDYRPGLVIAGRRRLSRAALATGGLITTDGLGLGLDPVSGRPAELSWAEADGGVLLICADPEAAARASFPVAWAAARRRKSLIVIDFTGSQWLAETLSSACAAADAPLAPFSSAGPGCYEPFRSHPPGQAASLAAQMIDWTGSTEPQRQAGRRFLADAFAVLAATPAATAPASRALVTPVAATPAAATVLDGLVALLEPAALHGARSGAPDQLRRRAELAARVTGSAGALSDDPATAAALSGQLRRLAASGPGRWLRLPAAAADLPISVGRAVRERGGVAFTLDRGTPDGPAAMVGRLAVADLAAVLRGLSELRLRGDGLAWIHGCEAVDPQILTELMTVGQATGTAVVLSTGSVAAAQQLVAAARVVVTAGPTDRAVAARLAELAKFRGEDAQSGLAERLSWQDEDEFAVLVRGPRPRFLQSCRSVPAGKAQPR